MRRFEYEADAADEGVVRGSIEAASSDEAVTRLRTLGLVVTTITPAPMPAADAPSPKARPLRGDDLVAFNEQLAQLTGAGLALERGLRTIADDMPRGGIRQSIHELADELERGTDIDKAIDQHTGRFPATYGSMLRAGIRCGDLSGVLAGVGRHMMMMRRMQAMLWRTLSYPLMVLVTLAGVLLFMSLAVIPPIRATFDEVGTRLPWLTRFVFGLADWLPWIMLLVAIFVVMGVVYWRVLRASGQSESWVERTIMPLPLIGPALRLGKVSQWCSALTVAINAGMELLLAIRTASEATGSPRLMHEAEQLAAAHREGTELSRAVDVHMLPAAALASIDLAIDRGDLAMTLRTLSAMYEQQVEQRMAILRSALLPIALVIVGAAVTLVIAAMFLPLSAMLGGV
jgi:type II secretory pathway component PulF